MSTSASPRAGAPDRQGDRDFTQRMLQGVSRTFALTIPELPAGLCEVVSNGYLLCRIADTIEDEPGISYAEKRRFHQQFAAAVASSGAATGHAGPGDRQGAGAHLANELAPRLSKRTLDAERELVRELPRVLRLTHSFNPRQRAALARCVRIMCAGMDRFQSAEVSGHTARRGLADVAELHEYCYYVAGVVGEMLTDLFCDSVPGLEARRAELERLSVSFGQGLQMTNILKDIWYDLEYGFCWLPRAVFARHGFDLDDLVPGHSPRAFQDGLLELLAIAHGHLANALEYILLIPPKEKGIRRFCLWALGMAVLTLRKIHKNRGFLASREVKISRRSVKATVIASNLTTTSDRALRYLFKISAHGLPAPRFVVSAPVREQENTALAVPDGNGARI